jgi:hypothetical protein
MLLRKHHGKKKPEHHLKKCTMSELNKAMSAALKLGYVDAKNEHPSRSGKDIARAIGVLTLRNGHFHGLRAAYVMGVNQVAFNDLDD